METRTLPFARRGTYLGVAIGGLFLSGCVTVPVFMTATSADRSFVLNGTGTQDPNARSGKFSLSSDGAKISCEGNFTALVKQSSLQGISEKLQGNSICNDGRTLAFDVTMTDLSISKGSARDDCGNTYDFYFGASPSRVQDMSTEIKQTARRSDGPGDGCSAAHPSIPPHRDPMS